MIKITYVLCKNIRNVEKHIDKKEDHPIILLSKTTIVNFMMFLFLDILIFMPEIYMHIIFYVILLPLCLEYAF